MMDKTVAVKFKTRSAGPRGTIYPGDVAYVPASEAQLLIKAKYAEAVVEKPEETAKASVIPNTKTQTAAKKKK